MREGATHSETHLERSPKYCIMISLNKSSCYNVACALTAPCLSHSLSLSLSLHHYLARSFAEGLSCAPSCLHPWCIPPLPPVGPLSEWHPLHEENPPIRSFRAVKTPTHNLELTDIFCTKAYAISLDLHLPLAFVALVAPAYHCLHGKITRIRGRPCQVDSTLPLDKSER